MPNHFFNKKSPVFKNEVKNGYLNVSILIKEPKNKTESSQREGFYKQTSYATKHLESCSHFFVRKLDIGAYYFSGEYKFDFLSISEHLRKLNIEK